jgi:hypothetical protein
MARVTAALLHNNSNSNRHPTIIRRLVANEAVAAVTGDSSNSAMGISDTPASAATTVTTDVAGAISGDAEDSVRRTDRAAVEAVVAEEDSKSRRLAHQSLR